METPLILYARGSGLYRSVTLLEKAFFVHRVAVVIGAGHPNEAIQHINYELRKDIKKLSKGELERANIPHMAMQTRDE
jgi:hypothetical protein